MPQTDSAETHSGSTLTYDIAIIGSGLAGMSLALRLETDLKIGIFSKPATSSGASEWAQGGIAAVLDGSDSFERHANDTLKAGAGLCNDDVVQAVVRAGPLCVGWLAELGVPFTRDNSGLFHLGREGGHSARRIAHVLDATGKAVLDTLRRHIGKRPNITVHNRHVAIDLRTEGKVCTGFHALDTGNGRIIAVGAQETALASGGIGKVYLYTTNPDASTGDGIAMAWRAGCRIANMEFVQFHPTCLYHPEAKSFLISEAVRGEGGILLADGRRFMPDYHSQAELAPRDIVARAMDEEMKRSGADHLELDVSGMGLEFLQKHFPNILRRCGEYGIDISRRPIPVVPAAHYSCGGIVTDIRGSTDIDGLTAIGECACTGLHGANRLASNSLLECVALAMNAAERLKDSLPKGKPPPEPWDNSQVKPSPEEVMVSHNWDELRRLMWNYVGIARTDERLDRARRRLKTLRQEVGDYYGNYILRQDFLELRNLVDCAEIMVDSAMLRRESRGLHHNSNCPETSRVARDTVLSHAKPASLDKAVARND